MKIILIEYAQSANPDSHIRCDCRKIYDDGGEASAPATVTMKGDSWTTEDLLDALSRFFGQPVTAAE